MRPFRVMHKFGTGGGGAATYLDDLAVQPRAALSLQKLISTATNALRVRRSSDNAEQDIGFSGDSLDTAALASFVGSGSGYVVTWYDQTGNAKHETFATSSAQPRIVNAGTYDGKLVFNGTSHAGMIAALTDGTTDKLGIYTRMSMASLSATQIVCELSTNYNSVSRTGALLYADGNALNAGMANASAFFLPPITSLSTITTLLDRAGPDRLDEIKMYLNGSAQTWSSSDAIEVTGNFGAFDFYVGGRAASSFFAAMELETLVLYTADSSAIRSDIEALIA